MVVVRDVRAERLWGLEEQVRGQSAPGARLGLQLQDDMMGLRVDLGTERCVLGCLSRLAFWCRLRQPGFCVCMPEMSTFRVLLLR